MTQADIPPAVVAEDHDRLAVVGTALTLGGEIVGVAVAGYALTASLDQHALERLARNSGRSFETVWAAGRQERHVPCLRHRCADISPRLPSRTALA